MLADSDSVSHTPTTHPSFGVNSSSAAGEEEEFDEDEDFDEDAEIEEEINRIEDQIEGELPFPCPSTRLHFDTPAASALGRSVCLCDLPPFGPCPTHDHDSSHCTVT